jgi:hypothetical protein
MAGRRPDELRVFLGPESRQNTIQFARREPRLYSSHVMPDRTTSLGTPHCPATSASTDQLHRRAAADAEGS